MKQIIAIIGAGPAGLTSAFELLKQSDKYEVIVFEESNQIGGISQTVNHNGNRIDIGGHRFFSKDQNVMKWWLERLPLQGQKSIDDALLNRDSSVSEGGPNPNEIDKVFLFRKRISRIFYKKHFFDYPITVNFTTIKNLGFVTTILAGFSYIKSTIVKQKESNLENFYINRFGKVLYRIFFEGYTYKVWGKHPKNISADWGSQRVKGLSILAILKNILMKALPFLSNGKVETSLIESFYYPKMGPGQLWESVADEIRIMGGNILMNSKVVRITHTNQKVTEIEYVDNGKVQQLKVEKVISSMPLKDLYESFEPKFGNDVHSIAKDLPYRDFITVGLLVDKLAIVNKTDIKTLNNLVPDCWIYVQDSSVNLGRIQIFNNWSPYMVKDFKHKVWIGLEYFCDENGDFWNLSEEDTIQLAQKELIEIGVINKSTKVFDSTRIKIKKAYPAYFGTYEQIDKLTAHLDTFENLFCVGRNGQHRYNNTDHSMVTAFETVDYILGKHNNKSRIWEVNTEKDYHEASK